MSTVTTITGENDFLRQQQLDAVVSTFLAEPSHDHMAIERLDGEGASLEQLRDSVSGLSLFSEDKLVILRSGSALKAFAEAPQKVLQDIADNTDVVLLEPKLDKRTTYYKYLKKNTKFVQCDALDGRQLSQWITEVVKENAGTISSADSQLLVDRVGLDQQQLYSEITKLVAYNPHITKDSITLLTDLSPQGTMFELLDAAFAGKPQKAMALYQAQRQQKLEPLAIVGMLAWQIHIVAVVQAGKGRDDSTIAKDAGINPYVVRKSRAVAQRLSQTQLKKLVQRLLKLDIDLKSKTLNPDDVVSQFILELSRAATT